MADLTNFTWSGTGGFTADMSVTRTLTCGSTAGGSITTALNLAITAGAAIPTITTGSWFNNLNFTGSTATPAVSTVNVTGNLTLAAGGTYTNLSITAAGTGTITNNAKTIAGFIVNNGVGTVTLSAALSVTTFIQTAGTIDFATFNLTCSSTALYASGTFTNLGTITCTTFTVSGTFAHSSGTITPSVSFVNNSGSYTQTGTSVLSAVPTFTQIAGNVTFRSTYALTATGTYTLTAGALTLGGNLTTGIFASSGTVTRSIAFSTFNIVLAHTTAATVVLSMADLTNFTWSGTGGFTTAMSVTRTLTCGSTAGGSITTAPNLTFTSGASIPTITTGSWFKDLNFSTTTFDIGGAPTINVAGNLTLSATGGASITLIYTATFNMVGTGLATLNGRRPTAIAINTAGTITSVAAMQVDTAFTITAGTMDFANFAVTITSGTFTWSGGTFTNMTSITASTFTLNGPTYAFSSGTITATTVNITGNGSLTFSGTASLPSVSTINQTLGNVTFGKSATFTNVVYTLIAGTLTLGNFTLQIARFLATGTSTRTLDFGTSSILQLAGNNVTIWDGGGTGFTILGTMQVTSLYAGAIGTRTINAGTGWTEANTFDVGISGITGINVGTGTDTVIINNNVKSIDMTGMACIFSPGTLTVYGNYTIPAAGGTVSASALGTTFASTNATARTITVSRSIDFPITISGVGGTFNLGANLTTGTTRKTTLSGGTLGLNGYNLTTGLFEGFSGGARTIAFGTNSITVNSIGIQTVWDIGNGSGLTFTGTPTVNVTSASGTISILNNVGSSNNTVNFNFPSGSAAVTFTAGVANNIDFTGWTGSGGSSVSLTVFGNFTLSAGMTASFSATTTFAGTSGTQTIITNGKTMGPIAINGVGGSRVLGSNLTSTGAITVLAGSFSTSTSNYAITCTQLDSSTTTSTRTISLNGSTITLSLVGAAITLNSTNLTFDAGTSQITLTGLGTVITPVSISAIGGATFYNVSYTGLGYFNFSTISTYNNFTFTSPITVTLAANITISGALTSTGGSVSSRSTITSDAPYTTQRTLSAGSVSLSYINFAGINAAGAAIPFTGTSFGDLGNNTNITFTAGVNKYWSLAAGGNWNSVAWATTSGGTPNANNYPLPQDSCIIENTGLNVSATITMNVNATFTTIDMSTRTNAMTLSIPDGIVINVLGDWINGSGLVGVGSVINSTGGIYFSNNVGGTSNITSAGKVWSPYIYVNGNVTVKLLSVLVQNAVSFNSTLNIIQGSINLNGFDWTCSNFVSQGNNSTIRSISFGSNFINLTSITVGAVNLNIGNSAGFSATGAGGFKANMSITRQFSVSVANGTSPSPPNLFINAGASIPTFVAESCFTTLDFTGSTCTPAAGTVDVYNLVLAAGGTYTNLTVKTIGTGTITPNAKTLVALNCSNGTTTLSGTLTAPTTVNGGTLVNPTGAILNTATLTLTTGTVNLTGGTLPTTATFTHTAGTLNVTTSTSLTATSTYGFASGAINLSDSVILSVGIFSSAASGTRSIAFGSVGTGNINLTHTTAATVVLSMADLTGFTCTGLGGFTVATMTVTRTFTVGTTAGATSSNAPSLAFTTGASIATITSGSWFNLLNYGTTSFTQAASTLNVNSITLSATGTYTALILNIQGTGTLTGNSKTTAAITLLAGTLTVSGTISCTTFTINGPTFNFTSGTLNPSTGFTLTSGSFTYGGTAVLGATAAFAHTAGSVTLNTAYALTATGTYTFTAGTLTLGANLTTGIFSSTNTNTRSIAFGSNNIILATTTAAAINLAMAIADNFTYTTSGTFGSGTGCFQSTMSTTRTFQFGTTSGGSVANAPILYLASGASIATITTGSWFREVNFGTTAFTIAATNLNLANIYTVSSTSVLTALTATMVATGTIYSVNSIGPVVVNTAGITTSFQNLATNRCTTLTVTQGTVFLNSNCTLICSSTCTLNGGTLTNDGQVQCTTLTIAGSTYSVSSICSWIISTSIVITSGSLTVNFSAAGGLGSVPTFTHTAGTVTFNTGYSLTATGTYTFTAGTLTLADGVTLNTGIFSSSNTNTRSIAFGNTTAGNINLTHTTALTTVLSMADLTGFSDSGPGGFTVAAMGNTRTLTYGTTGGTTSNAANLTFTTGASIATITSGSWFNNLNFGTTTFNPGTTTLNIVSSLTLSSGGSYLTLTPVPQANVTYTFNSAVFGPLAINTTFTVTLGSAANCTTFVMTAGTLNFASFNLTCSSTATYNGGTLSNFGTLACTTFTNNGTLSLSSGAINPTVSFVQAAGSFTIGGTATIGTTPLFTHTAGTVTFNTTQSIATTGTYTFTAGTLTLADGVTLNTGIFSSTNANTRSIAFGSLSAGNINLTHTTAATVVLSMAIVTGFTYTGPGGFTVADMGNTRTLTYGTTGGSITNAPNLTFTTGASVATLTTASWFKNLNFGTTAFNPGTTTLNIVGNLTLSSGGVYTTTTINPLASGTYRFNGTSLGPFTVNTSGITITLADAGASTTLAVTLGTLDFASFNFTCSSTATYNGGTLSNIGTISCTTFTINGPAFNFTSGTINPSTGFTLTSGSFTLGGTATIGLFAGTFTHTAGTVTFNKSYAFAFAATYLFTAGTLNIASGFTMYVGIFSSANTNTRSIAFGTSSAGYVNLTGAGTILSMATVTGFTWTGPGGFQTDNATYNISTLSFGNTAGGSTITAPNLSFTTAGGSFVQTITTGSWFNNLDFGTTTFNPGTTALNLAGGLTLSSGGTYTTLTPTILGTGTITSNGKTIPALIVNTTGTATLADALIASGAFTLTQGTLTCSTFSVTSATFASTGTATRSMSGSGTYTITGAGATAFSNASATGITITGLTISMTAATAKTFAGGGGSYPTLNQGGAGALTISGNNSFSDLTATTRPSTITFTASSTQTFTAFTLSGILGSLVTINSSTPGTRAILSKASGTVSVNYLSIQDSNATGGAGWYAGTTSTNVSNNLGWIFTAPPVGGAYAGNFFAFF